MSPVVLLHPLGADVSFWSVSAPLLERPTIAVNLPGHGGRPLANPDIGTFADRVFDDLLGAGIKHAIVAGLSLGGTVAIALAARHPECVSGLVLVDALAVYPEPLRRAWLERAVNVRARGPIALADAIAAMWFGDEFPSRAPEVVARARRVLLATDPEGYARACEALYDVDVTGALPHLKVPTLVLCGDQDAAPFVEAAPALAAAIPNAELRWLTSAFHASVLMAPSEFASEVRDFCGQHGL